MIRRKKEPKDVDTYTAKGDGRWIVLADGTRERHVCTLPWAGPLGWVVKCGACGQVWSYTTDNIASCFWVHAGWLKRLAFAYVKGESLGERT